VKTEMSESNVFDEMKVIEMITTVQKSIQKKEIQSKQSVIKSTTKSSFSASTSTTKKQE